MSNDTAPVGQRKLLSNNPRPRAEMPSRPPMRTLPTRGSASVLQGLPTVAEATAAVEAAEAAVSTHAPLEREETFRSEPVFEPAVSFVPDPAPEFRVEPVFAPAVVTERPSAPAPVRAPLRKAAIAERMHAELTQPLSEIIPRRDAQDFSGVFRDLVAQGVSDVHMVRSVIKDNFTVEARVDGAIQPVHTYEGTEAQTIVTLLKTDAKMTTDSNLIPEDGSYPLPIDGYPYRARAVSLPLFDGGERLVFRLPQTGRLRSMDELGFTQENLEATQALLAIPGGMTLFAGPTGEGKSTTSLSSLMHLKEHGNGVVMTLEDPVERVMDGMSQMEVNEAIPGAGFADMMKFLVRSDSNVLFIGEIRDRATATAAVEIAKSGRRVIATIHATDNISAYLRLMGMVDDTNLSVLESINGVVSQRLIPRLVAGTDRFSGLYPLHEVTASSDKLADVLVANTSRTDIRAAAAETSTTFRQNVDELVEAGITTLAEAKKVVRNV